MRELVCILLVKNRTRNFLKLGHVPVMIKAYVYLYESHLSPALLSRCNARGRMTYIFFLSLFLLQLYIARVSLKRERDAFY